MTKTPKYKVDTLLAHLGRAPAAQHGAVNPPVYHASTILFETVAAFEDARQDLIGKGRTSYARYGTPTTFALEETVAALEGGYGAVAVPTGLAAITSTLSACVAAGDHILVTDAIYRPTRQVCDHLLGRFGVETTYYDPLIGAGIADLIRPNTKAVFLESPGSLTFEVQDVPAITAAAHAAGAVVIMDNTWATPLYFKPLDHGVDVVIHSATKYIVGHADAMLGLVVTSEAHYRSVRRAVVLLGHAAAPDDVYLALRGLRTLSVRLARHEANGLKLATWLQQRPEVARVLHPALPDDPGHALWRRDFTGACGLFGVVLEPYPKHAVAAMLDGLALFGMGVSWGGYESLILPVDPKATRTATVWDAPGPTLRIHAGLEDPDDLIADLEAGFGRLNRAAQGGPTGGGA
ncbi:MAG: cystathionine beta-lyase [Kiloniellaceae bacterium]